MIKGHVLNASEHELDQNLAVGLEMKNLCQVACRNVEFECRVILRSYFDDDHGCCAFFIKKKVLDCQSFFR